MTAGRTAPGAAALFGPVAVAILCWILHLGLVFSLVRHVCRTGSEGLFHLATVGLLTPVVLGGIIAWRTRRSVEGEGDEESRRVRFLGTLGLALSAVAATLIVVQWTPVLVLEACR